MTDEERKAKRAAYMREWTAKNREKVRADANRRYAERPELREKAKNRAAEWAAANPERAKALFQKSYQKRRVLKGRPSGDDHHNWVGDGVSYHALHSWVARHKGTPSECEHCGTTEAKVFDWANVDHKYRRDLNDYIRLCRSCHRKYDYEHGLSEKGGPRKE